MIAASPQPSARTHAPAEIKGTRAYEAIRLLLDITALAEEVLTKPLVLGSDHRTKRCEDLTVEIEAAAAAGYARHYHLDNFAPLLLQAIDRALYRRHLRDERGAADWDGLIGHLLPLVRNEAAAALGQVKGEG